MLALFTLLAFSVSATAAGQSAPTASQPPAPDVPQGQMLHATVDLVTVDAQVLQKKTGRPVGSLKREDFELYEDGLPQEISFFSQDTLPLSVVLLFDLTDSVRPVLKPLGHGALDALQHLKPEDEVAVMVYAASAQLLQDFTKDRPLAVAAIEKASDMKSGEAAFFNEAIFQAASEETNAKNPNSRRLIIWLTDNVPNFPSEAMRREIGKSVPAGSLHTEKDAFRQLFETGTTVSTLLERSGLSDAFTVAINKNPMFAPLRMMYPPGDVYKYAAETGGQVMSSGKEDVSTKLAALIDQIRKRYSLAYTPSEKHADGSFCTIKLKLASGTEKREGKLIVRAKRGYYWHASSAPQASAVQAVTVP
jgi:VWFA-related protein